MATYPKTCYGGFPHDEAIRAIVTSIKSRPFRLLVYPFCTVCQRKIMHSQVTHDLELAVSTIWAERPVCNLDPLFWGRVKTEYREHHTDDDPPGDHSRQDA